MTDDAARSGQVAAREHPFSLVTAPGAPPLSGFLQDTGSGPVGVFVHGFRSTCAGDKSLALARSAAQHGRSWVRFDLRAHGASPGDFRDFRVSTLLDDVLAVLDWCPPRPLVVVGSSLGGWLATLAARARPTRIARLILIAPAFNFVDQMFGRLPATQRRAWQDRGTMDFQDAFSGGQFTLDHAVLADARRFDVLDGDWHLPCPVDIYHGERDEIVNIALSRQFVDQVRAPARALHVLPRGDHRLAPAVPLILADLARTWGEQR